MTDKDEQQPKLQRMVLLLTEAQFDFVSDKIDRLTSRSSYVRDLITREMEAG
jgi:uncharacterized membrane protein